MSIELPPYIYGREAGPNEKVWTESAVREAISQQGEPVQAESLRIAGLTLIGLAEHDPQCEVFDLDDEGKHRACTCGLASAIATITQGGKNAKPAPQPPQQGEPAHDKKIAAMTLLIKSLEAQLSHHREQADKYREAVNSLESERAANSRLTAELELTQPPQQGEPDQPMQPASPDDMKVYQGIADNYHSSRAAQQGEPVACLVGIKGSAFDLPQTKRAYTYAEQPGNVAASKMGRACSEAAKQSAGDSIDRGLALLQELQTEGFGVFDLGAEYTLPQRGEPAQQEPVTNITFGMKGSRLCFAIGVQTFTLDYEPTEPEEFEFMQKMLTNAIGRLKSAPQPAQQPLTQPEKQRLWNDAMCNNRSSTTDAAMDYGSAVEAAHGIGEKP